MKHRLILLLLLNFWVIVWRIYLLLVLNFLLMKIDISQSMIDNAKEGNIIASGVFKNSPEEVYLTNDKNARVFVRWVAVR